MERSRVKKARTRGNVSSNSDTGQATQAPVNHSGCSRLKQAKGCLDLTKTKQSKAIKSNTQQKTAVKAKSLKATQNELHTSAAITNLQHTATPGTSKAVKRNASHLSVSGDSCSKSTKVSKTNKKIDNDQRTSPGAINVYTDEQASSTSTSQSASQTYYPVWPNSKKSSGEINQNDVTASVSRSRSFVFPGKRSLNNIHESQGTFNIHTDEIKAETGNAATGLATIETSKGGTNIAEKKPVIDQAKLAAIVSSWDDVRDSRGHVDVHDELACQGSVPGPLDGYITTSPSSHEIQFAKKRRIVGPSSLARSDDDANTSQGKISVHVSQLAASINPGCRFPLPFNYQTGLVKLKESNCAIDLTNKVSNYFPCKRKPFTAAIKTFPEAIDIDQDNSDSDDVFDGPSTSKGISASRPRKYKCKNTVIQTYLQTRRQAVLKSMYLRSHAKQVVTSSPSDHADNDADTEGNPDMKVYGSPQGTTWDVTAGITTGVTQGTTWDVTVGITTGVTQGQAWDVTPDTTMYATQGTTWNVTPDTSSCVTQGTSRDVTAGITTGVTQSQAWDVTPDTSLYATQGTTWNVTPDASSCFTQGTTWGVTQGTIRDVTQGTTEGVTQGTTWNVTQGTTEGVTQGTTEDVTQGPTEDVTQGTTEDVTPDTTEDVTQGTTEDVTQGTTEDVTQGTTEDVTQGTTWNVTPYTTSDTSHGTADNATQSTIYDVIQSTPLCVTQGTTVEEPESRIETGPEPHVTSTPQQAISFYTEEETFQADLRSCCKLFPSLEDDEAPTHNPLASSQSTVSVVSTVDVSRPTDQHYSPATADMGVTTPVAQPNNTEPQFNSEGHEILYYARHVPECQSAPVLFRHVPECQSAPVLYNKSPGWPNHSSSDSEYSDVKVNRAVNIAKRNPLVPWSKKKIAQSPRRKRYTKRKRKEHDDFHSRWLDVRRQYGTIYRYNSSSDSDSDDEDRPRKRTRFADMDFSSSDSGSSSSGSLTCSSSSSKDSCNSQDSDSDNNDEIDLLFEHNPCPKTCVCKSHLNMKCVPRKPPKVQGFGFVTPMYKKVLQQQLLKNTNILRNQCCKHDCSHSWWWERPSTRDLVSVYSPSDLRQDTFSWGTWKRSPQEDPDHLQ